MRTMLAGWLVAAVLPGAVPAQELADPATRIRKIMEQVADEMQQIDRLLLQTSRDTEAVGQAADAAQRTVRRFEELFRETQDSQGAAIRGIDSLIEEIEKLSGT